MSSFTWIEKVLSTHSPKCDICDTDNFVLEGRAFELALKCVACNIVFCISCAGRELDPSGIEMLRCPKCMGSKLREVDLFPDDNGLQDDRK